MSNPNNIQVLTLDVDGVLTDGTIAFDPATGREIKSFHVHDGLGLTLWKQAGNEIILISGRDAEVVTTRASELGITHVIQGSVDKIADLQSTLELIGASPVQTAFVGDDLGDLAVMRHVGYAIAVRNAVQEVQDAADWVTNRVGGHGAVRDAVEHLMKAAGTWSAAVKAHETEITHQ